jgi:hypothetical protein
LEFIQESDETIQESVSKIEDYVKYLCLNNIPQEYISYGRVYNKMGFLGKVANFASSDLKKVGQIWWSSDR